MQEDLKNTIETLFIGTTPDPIKNISLSIGDIASLIEKQNVKSVYQLNYAQLIEDMLILINTRRNENNKGEPLTIESLSAHQYFNRIGIKLHYYKTMQNKDTHINIKLETAYFIRNFLQTATKIYGIDMLHGQDAFIQEIVVDEEKCQGLITEYNELLKAIEDIEEDNPLDLSQFWYHTPEQLSQISKLLYQSNFTDTIPSFCQAFSRKIKSPCNWTKSKTTLIYLFWLLYNDQSQFPDPIFNFIIERFTFDGKQTNSKILNTQYGQISGRLIKREEHTKGQYLSIYKICKSAIPSL